MLEKFNETKNIFLSGGPDSALLLYQLLKEQPETETRVLTWTDKTTHYQQAKKSIDVLNWCIQATGNNNVVHIIKYSDNRYEGCLNKLGKKFGNGYKICFGINALPKEDIDIPWGSFSEEDIRLRTNTSHKDVWQYNGNLYCPYITYDKKEIARMYMDNNLMDLFRLTSSCENEKDIGVDHCEKCWACKERYWGFGKY